MEKFGDVLKPPELTENEQAATFNSSGTCVVVTNRTNIKEELLLKFYVSQALEIYVDSRRSHVKERPCSRW